MSGPDIHEPDDDAPAGRTGADPGAPDPLAPDSILSAVGEAFEREHGPTAAAPSRHRSISGASATDAGTAVRRGPGAGASLSDPAPATRLEALTDLAGRQPTREEALALERSLLFDPDPDLRVAAAEALASVARMMPLRSIQSALLDPTDDVRAAAVRLAAAKPTEGTRLLLGLIGSRRWPRTQRSALEALPELLQRRGPLNEQDLDQLLAEVAAMEPPPLEEEAPLLGALARAVGIERVAQALSRRGPLRLGALRLLLADGSAAALRRVAQLSEDPLDEARIAARMAANALAAQQPAGSRAARRLTEPAEEELMLTLARGLEDPDQRVRAEAARALANVRRTALLRWVEARLEAGPYPEARAAATTAEALRLRECVLPLLRRGCRERPERQGPFLRALATMGLEAPALVDAIRALDPALRHDGVRIAWQVAGRALVPHLSGLLDDGVGAVRVAVLEVLAHSGQPSMSTLAMQILRQDPSAVVRATALALFSRADPEVRADALAEALEDPDPDVRATAVERLAGGLGPDAAAVLLEALEDPDERVWRAAARHLSAVSEEAMPLLWTALSEAGSPRRAELVANLKRSNPERLLEIADRSAASVAAAERRLAVELAAEIGGEDGVAVALPSLEDPDPVVRRAAAAAMAVLRSPTAIPALTRSLSDPRPEIRIEAVRALGLIDDNSVLPVLVETLKDPEVRVRQMATEALVRWRSPAVATRLAAALASPDLRRSAVEVLERLGPVATRALVDVVGRGEPAAAVTAAAGLLKRVTGADAFLEGLTAMDPDERLRSVEVLGAIGGAGASEALLTTLTDPDQRVRLRAVEYLGEMGDPRSAEMLKTVFFSDPVLEVAAAAEAALRKIGTMPSEPAPETAPQRDTEPRTD